MAARTQTRAIPYDELRARLRNHHRSEGKQVDFHMPEHGGIVIQYRLRDEATGEWQNLLPVGVYDKQYREVLQRLVPVLFPDEQLTIRTVVRHGPAVTVEVET